LSGDNCSKDNCFEDKLIFGCAFSVGDTTEDMWTIVSISTAAGRGDSGGVCTGVIKSMVVGMCLIVELIAEGVVEKNL